MLFTGDLEGEGEEELAENNTLQNIDVLKVAHHGSKNSTGEEFLENIQPQLGLISCSEKNRYGHPSPDTMKRLEEADSEIFCTKDTGAVTIRSDGKTMEADSFKKGS